MSAERWLPVVGFEGFYEVSDHGRVRTVERMVRSLYGSTRKIRSRMRRTVLLKGYPAVNLSARNVAKMRAVHVMVLEAFVGPRPSAVHEACHGDGNALNNNLCNLRWDTKAANKADSFAHGTAVHGERVGGAKLTVQKVLEIRGDRRSARSIARELGVNKSTIARARNGRSWARSIAEVAHG